MKRKSMFFLTAALILSAVSLVSCGGDKEDSARMDNDEYSDAEYLEARSKISEGYTSLENKNANGAIDADGYYEYAGQKFKTKDTYKTTYTKEYQGVALNYLCNTWTINSYHYTNMVDGLVENDKYGNIVGALAKSYKVTENADGTETWSFEIKEGVQWVTNYNGSIYAEVTADDFVTGIKYVLDPANGSGTVSNVTAFINGAADYYASLSNEDTTDDLDFDTVGVKAASKYVIEYTLPQSTPYFLSALTYSPFLPVNAKYLDEEGSDFGISEDHILVNGAFRITTHNESSKMIYTKNKKYYDRDHVYVNKVYRTFVPGTADVTTTRKWYESGKIDGFTVNAADKKGYKKYVSGSDGTGTERNPVSEICNGVLSVGDATYMGYLNFNRTYFEYAVDSDAKTDAQKKATAAALLIPEFRKGILYGIDAIKETAMYNESEPYSYLTRAYTNRELCSYEGKDYVDYVNDVYNEKQGTTGVDLTGINYKGDPIYDSTKSAEYFAAAKTKLLAAGYTESDFPIQIDVVASMDVETRAYEEQKIGAIESASNGLVKICYNVPRNDDEDTKWGSEVNNFDLSFWSGWGPDYADPATYLHTLIIDGDLTDYLGFQEKELTTPVADAMKSLGIEGESVSALQEYVLGDYTKLYEVADAITDVSKLEDRYKAFAEAEYYLLFETCVNFPWLQQNGYRATVSKTVPHQAGFASYGLTSDKFKNVVVTNSAITKEQRTAVDAYYDAGK
jgi:oligopeptide transport system substrate-binding protein